MRILVVLCHSPCSTSFTFHSLSLFRWHFLACITFSFLSYPFHSRSISLLSFDAVRQVDMHNGMCSLVCFHFYFKCCSNFFFLRLILSSRFVSYHALHHLFLLQLAIINKFLHGFFFMIWIPNENCNICYNEAILNMQPYS